MKFNITASQELHARIQNLHTELEEAKKLQVERKRLLDGSDDNIAMLLDIIKGLEEAKVILVEAGK